MTTEPVRWVSVGKTAILAILALLAAFSVVSLDEAQTAAILGVWAVVELASGQVVRSKVTPTGS